MLGLQSSFAHFLSFLIKTTHSQRLEQRRAGRAAVQSQPELQTTGRVNSRATGVTINKHMPSNSISHSYSCDADKTIDDGVLRGATVFSAPVCNWLVFSGGIRGTEQPPPHTSAASPQVVPTPYN